MFKKNGYSQCVFWQVYDDVVVDDDVDDDDDDDGDVDDNNRCNSTVGNHSLTLLNCDSLK